VGVIVGRDGGDVSDLLGALDRDGELFEFHNDLIDSHLDATSQVHGVHTSGDRLAAFLEDGTSEDGGSGGAIASLIVGLSGNLLNEVGTDVVVAVAELDVLGDSHTILGDLGHAESPVEDDIAATGSKSDCYGIGEHITALEHEGTGLSAELDVLTSEVELLGGDEGAAERLRSKSASHSGLHHHCCSGSVCFC